MVQVFLRRPKIHTYFCLSQTSRHSSSVLFPPLVLSTYLLPALPILPACPPAHRRRPPRPCRQRQRQLQRQRRWCVQYICERATEYVRACSCFHPPLLILAPRPAPNVHPTPAHPQSASASASSISICICICIASAPWAPYLARLHRLHRCTTAVPQAPAPVGRSISTPPSKIPFWRLSARQPESCLACHRQSRSVPHCYMLPAASPKPSQPAASAHEYPTMLSQPHSLAALPLRSLSLPLADARSFADPPLSACPSFSPTTVTNV